MWNSRFLSVCCLKEGNLRDQTVFWIEIAVLIAISALGTTKLEDVLDPPNGVIPVVVIDAMFVKELIAEALSVPDTSN